jgi:thiol-disulfide isomerase/thioredoxin
VTSPENDAPLLPGLDPEQATLAQDPSEDQGRIGYGKRGGIWTPLGLALILIAVLVAIGIYNREKSDLPENDIEIGTVAPDITQATFTGETFSLAEHRGKVVIVNFWATWCDPCRNEMPLLQATADSDPGGVGGVVPDVDADQRFLETNGLTYPNVRDDAAGGTDGFGPIELAYGIGTTRPVTIFISPAGEIAAFKLGELTEDELNEYIDEARGYTAEG